MPTSPKAFAEHLILLKGTVGYYEWILKGSEGMVRWPNLEFRQSTRGIDTFGTKKIDGQTCVVIANHQAERAKSLGWKVVSVKTTYTYIIR